MKNILLILYILPFFSLSQNKNNNDFILFLKNQNISAKEYVLNQFKKYDIVIICERSHKEFTQYELIREIIEDEYFINNVGHIFTELGSVSIDERLNEFLLSKKISATDTEKRLLSVYRDMFDQPYWEPYSYPWLINAVFNINQNLSDNLKIQMHPSDFSFEWSKIKSSEDYKKYYNNQGYRDSVMGINIAKKYDKLKKKKALVIMNYKHAFLKSHVFLNQHLHNTGEYLFNRYKNKVAGIYLMGLAIPKENDYTIVQNGKWDYYLELLNKISIGFNLKNTPFGKADFDVIPPESNGKYTYKYEDMFSGLIYYKPIKEHYLKTGWLNFASDDFLPELRRRTDIFIEAMDINLSQEQKEQLILNHNKIDSLKYPQHQLLLEKINRHKE